LRGHIICCALEKLHEVIGVSIPAAQLVEVTSHTQETFCGLPRNRETIPQTSEKNLSVTYLILLDNTQLSAFNARRKEVPHDYAGTTWTPLAPESQAFSEKDEQLIRSLHEALVAYEAPYEPCPPDWGKHLHTHTCPPHCAGHSCVDPDKDTLQDGSAPVAEPPAAVTTKDEGPTVGTTPASFACVGEADVVCLTNSFDSLIINWPSVVTFLRKLVASRIPLCQTHITQVLQVPTFW